MIPHGFDASACAARRAKLAARFDGSAWIVAGRASPRTYPANLFPYRAASHFLYFVGAPIEGASLLLANGSFTLLVEPPPPDDALWHGASPSLGELSELLGIDVRSVESLHLTSDVATLSAIDAPTRDEQQKRLGRALGTPADLALADAVIALRLPHDAAAQAELRRAAEATVAAHRAGMAATRPGVHEAEVRAAMEHVFAARGMGRSYLPIVSTHGEVLHNPHQTHLCQDGDLLLADVGAETAGGWAGDVTRTWPVSGAFSSTQREIYDAVLAAHAAAVRMVAPGVRYRDVHLRASEVLAEGLVALGILRGDPQELVADGVHALFFPHGVGHLIGLDVHDMEDLGDRAGYAPGRERSAQFGLSYLRLDRDLEPGMAVTIEPGFYRVPAILDDPARRKQVGDRVDFRRADAFADVRGIRIEDDVLVTGEGHEVLTGALARSASEVEALVGR